MPQAFGAPTRRMLQHAISDGHVLLSHEVEAVVQASCHERLSRETVLLSDLSEVRARRAALESAVLLESLVFVYHAEMRVLSVAPTAGAVSGGTQPRPVRHRTVRPVRLVPAEGLQPGAGFKFSGALGDRGFEFLERTVPVRQRRPLSLAQYIVLSRLPGRQSGAVWRHPAVAGAACPLESPTA